MDPLILSVTLCGAMTIYHEARGEPLVGQVAVAHVVFNRMHRPDWPNTVCGVVMEEGQFTFEWTPPNSKRDFEASIILWEGVLSSNTIDPTNGSCYYHAVNLRADKTVFFKQLEKSVRIGNHQFYKCHSNPRRDIAWSVPNFVNYN